jgi:glycogen synthase
MGARPDILHLHEWQCSAAAMLYWDVYYNAGFNRSRVVLTIHNMDNSGECRQDEFAVTGVPGAPLSPPLLLLIIIGSLRYGVSTLVFKQVLREGTPPT